MKKTTLLWCLVNSISCSSFAQNLPDLNEIASDTLPQARFNYKALILPTSLITYGVIGIESDQLKSFNTQLRDEITEDIDHKITIDDFTQWVPAASVYALNAIGIKGKHALKERSIILATSYLIMSSTVFSVKSLTKVERPDGSTNNSFPSGHTANAFAGAEFMWQEYKDQSVWYGISGYAVATGTGLFRIYNNRHWLTDVVTGAGIGILSTKIAYWVTPYLQEKVFHSSSKNSNAALVPFYNGQQFGVSYVKTF